MIPFVSIVLAVLLLSLRRADVPRKKTVGLVISSFFVFVLVKLGIYFQAAFIEAFRAVNIFVQWWLSSDQILFRRFLSHQAMGRALALGITVNIIGPLMIYLPVEFLVPSETIAEVRNWLERKLPLLKRLNGHENGVRSDEIKNFAFNLVKQYEEHNFEYLCIFLLSLLPLPFVSAILTAGIILAVETFEIKYGIVVIIFAKVVKVLGLSTIAYFAYFI